MPPSPIAACPKRRLRKRLEETGWDGSWYRRAYFDDGSPLGSSSNVECQIDSIPQSWSVLSGAADPGAPGRPWTPWTRGWSAATTGSFSCSTRLSTRPTSIPATSRATCPACARTAGSTPTRRSGRPWRSPSSATPRARGRCSLINPVTHGASPAAIEAYKVEPYVVAADVYAVAPHVGRGGWTWYTGSAGWMYRLIVESLLGMRLEVDRLRIEPCLPADWSAFTVHYRFRETVYHITVHQTAHATGEQRLSVDGYDQAGTAVPLVDDRREHWVDVWVRATR
jgi:cyclic beta-1,2-glucan synthetase